ncbi:MAG: response regulator [Lachnospiraceae bacterium]|nr:response regulator [Lachnospiraceae bacterium]
MKKRERSYLGEYIGTLLKKKGKENNSMLVIKHHNALYPQMEDIQALEVEKHGYKVIFHNYVPEEIRAPYEPFLDLIKSYVEKKQEEGEFSFESFFDKTKVYYVHRLIFERYLQGKRCVRKEDILVGEYEYEKKKFLEAVINMLAEISKEQPLFFILNETNASGLSLWKILNKLFQEKNKNLKFVLIYNDGGKKLSFSKQEQNQFMQMCKGKDLICDWIYEGDEIVIERSEEGNIRDYVEKLHNMSYTLEYEQAYYYLKEFFERLEYEEQSMLPEERLELLRMYFWTSLGMGEYSGALYVCEEMKRLTFRNPRKQVLSQFNSYYYKAMVHVYRDNEVETVENIEHCEKIAKENFDEKLIFRVNMIKNMARYSGWKSMWISELDTPVSYSFIEQCKEFEQWNHLAHIYAYSFNNDYHNFSTVKGIDERLKEFNKGIEIGKRLQNQQFLLEAYKKNIILASIHGYFEVCIYFYNKCMEIVCESNDEVAEAGNCNGMGYSNCGLEHYEQAHKYYNRALVIYYRHGMVDEVVETLYNLGINCILAHDYENASNYLLEAANILYLMKKSSIHTCDISKLFALIALSCFRQGIMHRCNLNLNNAKQYLAHIFGTPKEEEEIHSDDSMFLVYFVDALNQKKEENYEQALLYMNKAEFYMNRSTGAMFFNYPQYAVEKYDLLEKMGEKEKGIQVLLECKKYCRKNNYKFHEQQINQLLGKEIKEKDKIIFPEMKLNDITLEEISQWIKKEAAEKNHRDMMKTMQFFNLLQRFTNHMKGKIKEELSNIIPLLKNNFYLDKAFVIKCEENRNEIMYSDLEFTLSKEEINQIVRYFRKCPQGFVFYKNGFEHEEYEKVLEPFVKARMVSFVAIPNYDNDVLNGIFIGYIEMTDSWKPSKERTILDENDLEIFIYVFKQIFNAVEKLEARKKLVDANEKLKVHMEQLLELKNEAEAANEAKSNFLANMSHEIRTPMNSIIGMTEIVLLGKLEQEQRERVMQIKDAGKTLLSIINDILDFSKIESGKMEIQEVNYSVHQAIKDIKNILTTRIGEKDIRLKIMVNQDIPPYLYGDDMRIRQVILNLGDNAIKFTEKGSVTITIDYEKHKDTGILHFSVKDTGIGIAEKNIKRLFTSFHQLDGKRNRKIEGSGLGLAISKAFVNMMGGEIYVQSEYGKGSEFFFQIPQRIGTCEDNQEKEEKELEFKGHNKKVMVVDDNRMNRNVAEGLLKPMGLEIVTVESGIRALEILTERMDFDLIFMDHMMPDMDGIETTKRIRSMRKEYYKNVPIIALTANVVADAKKMFLECGMDDFIGKPIDIKQLKQILKKWIPDVEENICEKVEEQDIKAEDLKDNSVKIPGLDVEIGIAVSGSKEMFFKLLQVFYDTIEEKVQLISDYLEEGNIKNYTVEVHALKSAAMLIGAIELSNMAKMMEEFGKVENINELHNKTKTLLSLYESYKESLKPFVKIQEADEKKTLMPKTTLEKKLQELEGYMKEFQIDNADAIMEELISYRHEEEFEKILPELKTAIEDITYDIAEELLDEYKRGLQNVTKKK